MNQRPTESPVTAEERLFMGLVRQGDMAPFMGRLSQLTDEELRSIYALAVAAQREANRRRLAPSASAPLRPSRAAEEALPVDEPRRRKAQSASRAPKERAT